MYIILDDLLVENRSGEPDFLECVKMLLLAYKEGKHIIDISPKKVKEMLEDDLFEGEYKFILEHYYHRFARSVKGIRDHFSIIVKIISTGQQGLCYSEVLNKQTYYCLNACDINKSEHIQNTILLGENINDGKVYEIVGQYYLNSIGAGSEVVLRSKKQNGGGTTTPPTFENIYEEKDNFCLCILDSDMKSPESGLSTTVKKIESFVKRNPLGNMKCFYSTLLKYREIENIFPDQFYMSQYKSDVNKKNILTMINQHDVSVKRYIDLKNGLKCWDTQGSSRPSQYWRKSVPRIYKDYECPKISNKDYKCTRVLIAGFGKKILEDFVSFCKSHNIHELVDDCIQDIRNEWVRLGRVIASFCCGTRTSTFTF